MNQIQVTTVTRYSIALMILTSIHHVYGAIIYNTPWRLHILMISVPVIIVTLILSKILSKKTKGRTVVFWSFILVTTIFSVLLIGIFEGVYNHVFKNIIYIVGASGHTWQSLFPAPTYEIPNDFFFEMTGIGQGLIVLILVTKTIRLFQSPIIKGYISPSSANEK